jgi:alpha-N-arabinofuranosidase
MGRAVYQGVYDPESRHADQNGWRADVLEVLKPLSFSVMRYPGGNFASGYHWEDGIGPREERPTVRELAWQSIEPNTVGTDEFLQLCALMHWEPMITANMGTGTPEEARNWVEYCNAPTGSHFANLRGNNGHKEPYGVRLWCLGNEMDSPWQLGHVPAREYAIRAQQAAKMMKDVDPEIRLVAAGSCNTEFDSYLEWDRTVLEYLGDLADFLSLHLYVGNPSKNTADYLALSNAIDRRIEDADAVCRYVQAQQRSSRRAYLAFDEWNVWYRKAHGDHINGRGKFAPPLIEEDYNLEDALVVSSFLHSFLRHADVVKIANLAQIVNVIAPIKTRGDNILLQTIYHPFRMFSEHASGMSLRPAVEGPGYESQTHGYVHNVDCSAVLSGDALTLFLTNRMPESQAVRIDVADRTIKSIGSATLLTGPGPKSENTFENPEVVAPMPYKEWVLMDGRLNLELPAYSVTATTVELG